MIPTHSNAVAQQEDRECGEEAVIFALVPLHSDFDRLNLLGSK
jgi:hypothetical protein